jgi:hypothetical protein
MDPSWAHAAVGLAAVLAAPVALIVMRAPRSPLARVEARPGEAFSLRATVSGGVRLWLRYDLAYGPVEDAWRVDGEVRVSVDGAPAWREAVRLQAHEEATARPRRFAEVGSFYGLSSWSGPTDSGSAAATVFLGAITAPGAGAEVVVAGSLTPAEGTRATALTLFLSR